MSDNRKMTALVTAAADGAKDSIAEKYARAIEKIQTCLLSIGIHLVPYRLPFSFYTFI